MLRPALRAFALTLVLVLVGSCRAPGQAAAPPAAQYLARVPLEITSGDTTHRFTVEVASTASEQTQGLMYRTSLGADQGMLFPFDPPVRASFWMKNTLIPLDILFIRSDGSIARIAAEATPLSLDPIDAGETVSAVLEIKGGMAASKAIKAGDRVRW